jgi:hypothetical protein
MSERLVTVADEADAERSEPAACYQALRQAGRLAADAAMRCADAGEAANFALAALRSEFEFRFELIRQRRRPALIEPEPLLPVP